MIKSLQYSGFNSRVSLPTSIAFKHVNEAMLSIDIKM